MGRAIYIKLLLHMVVISKVKRLPCHFATLDLIGGHPFAKSSLQLLPEQGTVVRGRWLWQALLKPYPVGTDIFGPS